MVVTIQFQTPDDFKWIGPLVELLKQSNVKVDFKGKSIPKRSNTKGKSPKNATTPITDSLQGIIKLPDDFDYKSFMGDELQNRYLSNG